ncbi:MAG: DUF5011 domain-containing protein [Bacteroidota bacterium]|nr:DUF5011 domain-containing protein [Bacteroidota bacterium]
MKKILLSISIFMLAFLVNAQNPYPVLPIDTVQFVNNTKLSETFPNDSSDYINPFFKNAQYGDTVRFEGIVMMDPRLYGLSTSRKATVLQADTIARPWGGIEIMCEPSGSGRTLAQLLNDNKFYDNLKPGNKVRVTGVIRTFRGTAPAGTRQGQTQVNMIKANSNWENGVEFVDLNSYKVKPAVVRIDSLMTGGTGAQVQKKVSGEKWEGTYVELQNVTVASRTPSGSRWFWAVADANGNIIDINDFSAQLRNDNNSDSVLPAGRFTPPVIGTRISFLRGVIIENAIGGQYRFVIAPLGPSDIGPVSYTPPTVVSKERYPVVITSADSGVMVVTIQQGSAKVSNVKLFHTVGYASTIFDSITLTRNTFPNDTMVWYGILPSRPNNTIVKYYVKPTDINGFFTTSPDTFGSYSAYIVKNAGVNSIEDIQFSPFPNNATIWNNDSLSGVNIRGIVTSTSMTQGTTNIMTMQNGTGLNSAIIINRNVGDITSTWKVGDSISITNTRVRESFGNTTLNNVAGTKISSGNALPGFISLNIDSIVAINAVSARRPELCAYEGMLMNFDSVYVVNVNADAPSNFGEFMIHKDSTKTIGLRVDDISTKLPDNFNNMLASKQFMKYAKGIFILSFSNWKLEPRDSNDLDFSGAPDTQKPIITLIGKSIDSLQKNKSYVDPGATAMDNKDGNITSKIVRMGSVDSSKVGTYILKYTVADNAGNRDTVSRTVIVYTPVGINSNELVFAISNIYPNPAGNVLHVSVSGFQTLPLTASIMDLNGRVLISKTFNTKTIEHNFELEILSNGIYFCTLQSATGSKTIKFVVNK